MPAELIPITLPATYPVNLDDFKLAARISSDADDADIDRILKAATERVETLADRTFSAAQWRLELSGWPDDRAIPLGCKIVSVESITYTDTAGATQTLATSEYLVDARSPIGAVYLKEDEDDWVSGSDIKITFILEVPETARQAIIMLAGDWYEHRTDSSEVKLEQVPHGVMDLIRQISAAGVVT